MPSGNKQEQKAEPRADWQFSEEGQAAPANTPAAKPQTRAINWTASEFVLHDKSALWYMGIILSGIGISAITYFISARKDVLAPIIVLVATIIFAVYASRKPRELNYELDGGGLKIDQKLYPYAQFRSFSVIQEDGIESVWFLPLKRFNPGLTIYFAPEDRDKIVDVLSQYLPVEPRQPDPIDRLLHKIRF